MTEPEPPQTTDDGCCGGGVGPIPYPGCTDCPRRSQTTVHPFNVGYQARCDGLSEYDNPHTEQGRDRAAWQHGWDQADSDLEEEAVDAE